MRIHQRSRNRRGFTLTELMITCSLVGVLASIAIPQFMTYQARTRRSEGNTNVAGIGRAYKAFYAEKGKFPDMRTETTVLGSTQASLPDPSAYGGLRPQKMPWDAATEAFFSIVGWKPDGNVYYTYDVNTLCGGGCTADQTCFTVTAHGDVDGNGRVGEVMFVHPLTNSNGSPIAWCNSAVGNFPPPVSPDGQDVFDEPAIRLGGSSDLY